MSAPRSILVPVDGSSPSLAALEHAIALAEDSDSAVDVLHVESSVDSVLAPSDLAAMTRAMDEAVQRAHARLGRRISRRVVAGEPLQMILDAARERSCDLIVIGTHGRVGRLHSLLGSVAEGVVRNAPCPVLTVRDSTGGYQSFAERRHGRPAVNEPRPHH